LILFIEKEVTNSEIDNELVSVQENIKELPSRHSNYQ